MFVLRVSVASRARQRRRGRWCRGVGVGGVGDKKIAEDQPGEVSLVLFEGSCFGLGAPQERQRRVSLVGHNLSRTPPSGGCPCVRCKESISHPCGAVDHWEWGGANISANTHTSRIALFVSVDGVYVAGGHSSLLVRLCYCRHPISRRDRHVSGIFSRTTALLFLCFVPHADSPPSIHPRMLCGVNFLRDTAAPGAVAVATAATMRQR